MKLLSRSLITIGVFCYLLGIYNIWLSVEPNRLSFKRYAYAQAASVVKKSQPERVIIKGLNIDLPIIPSKITDGTWETTEQGASYLASSPIPGETGNSIIYAHNWVSLFGKLVNIRPGDEVGIGYHDKSTKTFVVKYTSEVTPDTSSILAPTLDKRITFYTCTAFLDAKRFVAVAVLKDK